ncbi:ExbD/TolR family protein [Elusimicrobiota bacterium]
MGKKRKKEESLALGDINVTAVVDISFSLVIFCMLSINLILTAGINVMESKIGASVGRTAAKQNISIKLTLDSEIFLNNEEIDIEDLSEELMELLPNTEDQMVMISADLDNTCEEVIDVLDIAKKAGAKKLTLMKNPEVFEEG